jgi:hypothetical protein
MKLYTQSSDDCCKLWPVGRDGRAKDDIELCSQRRKSERVCESP